MNIIPLSNTIENVNREGVKKTTARPDQIAENSQRPKMRLQYSEKIPQSEAGFSWTFTKICLFRPYI